MQWSREFGQVAGGVPSVARLWRDITYAEGVGHADDTVSAAKQGVARDVTLYSQRRLHIPRHRKIADAFCSENLPTLPYAGLYV